VRLNTMVVGVAWVGMCCVPAMDPPEAIKPVIPHVLSSMPSVCGDGLLSAQEECDPGDDSQVIKAHLACQDFYVPGVLPMVSFTSGDIGCYGPLAESPCTYDVSACGYDGTAQSDASNPYVKERDRWRAMDGGEWLMDVYQHAPLYAWAAFDSLGRVMLGYRMQEANHAEVVWKQSNGLLDWTDLGIQQVGAESFFDAAVQNNVVHAAWQFENRVYWGEPNADTHMLQRHHMLSEVFVRTSVSSEYVWMLWKEDPNTCVWQAMQGSASFTQLCSELLWDAVWLDETRVLQVGYDAENQILNTRIQEVFSEANPVSDAYALEDAKHLHVQRLRDGRVWLAYGVGEGRATVLYASKWEEGWAVSHQIIREPEGIERVETAQDPSGRVLWVWKSSGVSGGLYARYWDETHQFLGPVEKVSAYHPGWGVGHFRVMTQHNSVCVVWDAVPKVGAGPYRVGMRCVF
jgi:hypothetical protein